MLSRFRLSILFFAAALIVFSSCSKKTNKEGRYIPKTAGVVILVNGESMSSKLPWEEIKENAMFKDAYAEYGLDENIKSVLNNPENTGIDPKKNLAIYIQKDSIGGYIGVEGSVKDAEKFKNFYTTLLKGATASEKDGVHFLSNAKMTTSWDKEKFVTIIDVPGMNESSKYKNPYDTDPATSAPVSKRDAIAAAAKIYSLSEDNSLAKDEKFSELVATKGDFHFWISIGALAADNTSMAAMSMLNMSKLYENTFITGVTNFDNGKINVDMKTYAGKELTDLYKKYSDTKLNTDMIKRIPSKDVLMLFALSFKPDGLKEFIKLTGTEGFINAGASQLGFTFDDFIKANKGDILFAVSDIKKDSSGATKPNGLFAASIGDKAAFTKLITAGNKIGKEKMGESMKNQFAYNVSDDYFVIGTDKLNTDKFLSTANNSNFSFLDKISGSTSAFYLNIPGLMSSMGDAMKQDSLDNLSYQTTIKMWENVIATGGGFKDGASNIHIEFNLIDKSTNSLKQLNNYVSTMGTIEKQRKANRSKLMDDAMYEEKMTPPTVEPVEEPVPAK